MDEESRPKFKLRIQAEDLRPRDGIPKDIQDQLQRLGAPEGAPCKLDCECIVGLICRDHVCTADW